MKFKNSNKAKKKLRGRVVVITGASSGIGEALAYALAPNNVKLILNARNEEKIKRVAQEVQRLGSESLVVIGDIRDEITQNNIISLAKENYGRIDVLVNNAGLGKAGRLIEQSGEDINTMIDTNLKAVIKMTQRTLELMKNSNGGHIVNLSTALVFLPNKIFSVYIATKTAIKSFSDSIRNEMKEYGIKVTTVYPGPYNTHFHEVAGFGNVSFKCFDVEKLAKKIVKIIEKPKKDLIAPCTYDILIKTIKLLPFLKNIVIKRIEQLMSLKLKASTNVKDSGMPMQEKIIFKNVQ